MIVDRGDDSPDLLTCKGENMICKNCSREISDEAKFCPYCGNVIGVQPETITAQPESVVQLQPVLSEKEQRKLEKKRRKQTGKRDVCTPKTVNTVARGVVFLHKGILMLAFLPMTARSTSPAPW
mgnify:CR=1 FL=1